MILFGIRVFCEDREEARDERCAPNVWYGGLEARAVVMQNPGAVGCAA